MPSTETIEVPAIIFDKDLFQQVLQDCGITYLYPPDYRTPATYGTEVDQVSQKFKYHAYPLQGKPEAGVWPTHIVLVSPNGLSAPQRYTPDRGLIGWCRPVREFCFQNETYSTDTQIRPLKNRWGENISLGFRERNLHRSMSGVSSGNLIIREPLITPNLSGDLEVAIFGLDGLHFSLPTGEDTRLFIIHQVN